MKVYPPKFRRACRLYTFMAQWLFSQRRKSWSLFWTSSARFLHPHVPHHRLSLCQGPDRPDE